MWYTFAFTTYVLRRGAKVIDLRVGPWKTSEQQIYNKQDTMEKKHDDRSKFRARRKSTVASLKNAFLR